MIESHVHISWVLPKPIVLKPYYVVSCPEISTCLNVVFWCMCDRWDKIAELYDHQVMHRILRQISGFSVNLLRGYANSKVMVSYMERLHLLGLPSLELRRVHIGLTWCYKTLFADCRSYEQSRGVEVLRSLKAKFHCASWFETGRTQVRRQIPLRYLVRTSFESASNKFRTR